MELGKVQTMAAKMVRRTEQLPHEKRLKRLRLLHFQEEMAEVAVGSMAEVCKIMGVENKVKAEWISTHPVRIELWSLRKLAEDRLKAGKRRNLLHVFVETDSICTLKELQKFIYRTSRN